MADVIFNGTDGRKPLGMAEVSLTIGGVDEENLRAAGVEIAYNEVTITRYHVEYTRADGRNTPGADVPYSFDGAATGTIPAGGSLTLGFDLVRNVAKQESPLAQLRTSPNIITSIALVTFYGRDRVGNNVSVTGQIQIDFGNFGDF